jgi:hypothetical protein
MNIEEKKEREIQLWENPPVENLESESIENLVNKFCEERIFLEKLADYREYFLKPNQFLSFRNSLQQQNQQ